MRFLNRKNRKENIDIRCEAEYTTDIDTEDIWYAPQATHKPWKEARTRIIIAWTVQEYLRIRPNIPNTTMDTTLQESSLAFVHFASQQITYQPRPVMFAQIILQTIT